MTAQELATAVRYRLRVIAIVHNDSTYGAIKNIQNRNHQGRFLDVDLNNPDFLQLAAAYGVPGRRVQRADDFQAAVRESLDRDGPSVIEVPDNWRQLRDLAESVAFLTIDREAAQGEPDGRGRDTRGIVRSGNGELLKRFA